LLIDKSQTSRTSIFRQEAVNHYLQETEGKDILKVSPLWSWLLLITLGSMVLMALIFSVLGKVEVIEHGKGILRPLGGVRLITAQGNGTVTQVLAPSGTLVHQGDTIIKIDSPPLLGALMEAEQVLRSRTLGYNPVSKSQSILFDEQMCTAKEKIRQMEDETASYQRGVMRAQKRVDAGRELQRQGIIGSLEQQGYEDQLDAAKRIQTNSVQNLRQAKQELISFEAQRKQQIWSQHSEEELAHTKRESLDLTLRQNLIISPVDGMVDGLVARPGDTIQAGALVANPDARVA